MDKERRTGYWLERRRNYSGSHHGLFPQGQKIQYAFLTEEEPPPQETSGMSINEHIQCLADHALFLRCLSRLANQTDEIREASKNSADAALREAGIILSMLDSEDRQKNPTHPKKPVV